MDENSWPASRPSSVCQKFRPGIFVSIVIEQFTGNISDNCLVKAERDRQLTVTKVRKSESAAICNMFREISTRWQTLCYIYSCVKQGDVFKLSFEFPNEQQTENEEFYRSNVQQFRSLKIQHFNSLTDVKLCSDSNNRKHVIQNYVALSDNKIGRCIRRHDKCCKHCT